MTKRLLLYSPLALTGCNSVPGNSDLENSLEPKFASCQNIKLVDIQKTNGYEEDGYYRVEFTYGVALKDASQLKEMKAVWRSALHRPRPPQPSETSMSQRCANKMKLWKRNPPNAMSSLTMGSCTIRGASPPRGC